MDKLLHFLVSTIVTKPEEVKVSRQQIDGVENLNLSVAPEDMKVIIGKQGQTIRAVRHLIRLKALKEGVRANLVLEDALRQS